MVTTKHRQTPLEPRLSKNLYDRLSESEFNPRVSDFIALGQVGVIFASPTANKVIEHGGSKNDSLTAALFMHNTKSMGCVKDVWVFGRWCLDIGGPDYAGGWDEGCWKCCLHGLAL